MQKEDKVATEKRAEKPELVKNVAVRTEGLGCYERMLETLSAAGLEAEKERIKQMRREKEQPQPLGLGLGCVR